jgi:Glycerate kinase family
VTIADIPQRALIVSGPFGPSCDASRVVAAIGRGMHAGGWPEPDVCPLDAGDGEPATGTSGGQMAGSDGRMGTVRELLDALDFDARMRSARAVVVGAHRLDEQTLAGSVTFEIATRARQGGVPAYAVTGENALNSFDARMLDLQLILEARTARTLSAAGRKLAKVI